METRRTERRDSEEAGVTPVEGRGLSWRRAQEATIEREIGKGVERGKEGQEIPRGGKLMKGKRLVQEWLVKGDHGENQLRVVKEGFAAVTAHDTSLIH